VRVSGDAVRIPIIKLHGNLIISIQVALSDPMVQRLKDDVTEQIELTRPNGMAIDISGIDLMDSYISRAIRDVCIMAGLMGVRTVISGMDPMIAITLVEMDMGLEGVRTARDLEGALAVLDAEVARSREGAADMLDLGDAAGAPSRAELDIAWLR
jgi:rsbT antagonist protein RsbS